MSASFSCAKVLGSASSAILKNVFKRPAGNFPGKIALYVDRNLLGDLRPRMSEGSVLVVGTNGKTTVTLLLADILERAGLQVVCNKSGANLDSGVATALLETKQAQWGVFEMDEMWLARVLPLLQSTYVVLLNLFPDQEDRMTVADIQQSIIGALLSSPQTTLLYNADDPHCERIAQSVPNPTIAFGTTQPLMSASGEEGTSVPSLDEAEQAVASANKRIECCPRCGNVLDYSLRQYDQLGSYACPQGDFKRAELDAVLSDVHFDKDGLLMHVQGEEYTAPYQAEYMAYNLGLLVAITRKIGIEPAVIQQSIQTFNPQNGRLQQLEIQGHEVLINLAKNPAGFNQNIKLIQAHQGKVVAAFFVNNKEGDGRTTDWLDEIDFEALRDLDDARVYAGGMCASQLASRLARAGMNALIVEQIEDVFMNVAVDNALVDAKVFLIANYTALPGVRAQAVKLSQMPAREAKGANA